MEGAGQLASTLGQLVGKEYRLLSSVGGQVAELRDELATMNAMLRVQSETDEGDVDHFVREWMKQVRELAYDAEDVVDLYIVRIRCRLRDLGFIVWSKRLFTTLFSRRRLAGEIQALRARAVAISERHVRYGISRETPNRGSYYRFAQNFVHAFSPASNDPDKFVGISDQAKILADNVKENSDGDMKLKVFSIVGIGGLGKTTLAMEVSRLLEADFERKVQVSVPQMFTGSKDLKALLKRVLLQIVKVKNNNEKGIKGEDCLSAGEIDEMCLDELGDMIKERLKDKRYLIVIDDVWTISAWDAIQSKLPENSCGSRVLVTTRIQNVAKACSVFGNGIYHIKPLSVEDSRKLFVSRVFGSKDVRVPLDLQEAMDVILLKCVGLPMAIVSIASLLAGYNSPWNYEMWKRISRSIGYSMEGNLTQEELRQILTLSYNQLPHYLKGCVMYLSIFPKSYIINKDRLLWGWIAEGLVDERMGFTLLEVAEHYFEELVSRSMICVVANEIVTDGNKETFRVHDMMFEVMVSKSLESNFVMLVGSQYAGMPYHRVRRLTVHDGGQGRKNSSSKKMTSGRGNYRSDIQGMDLNYVRSLSMFDLKEHMLLDRLGEFTLLRVLDLEECKGLENKHMGAICRMYLLRFLGLKGTDISVVPSEVGDLQHLQTLDVYQTRLTKLPKTVKKLKKVERLRFSNKDPGNWATMWNPPRGISEMKALREVSNVVLDNVQAAQEIGDLEQLQAIDVYVDGRSEHKEEVRQALACSLGKTHSLRSLYVGDIIEDGQTLDYLIELPSPPHLLRCLRFSGNIARLPDWVGLLTYLVEFAISSTRFGDDELLGVLCKAPSLQSVLFGHSFYELVARTDYNFPALKIMRVPSYDERPKVFEFEEGSMTTLETLEVNFDGNREKSIVGIKHLTNLKKVQLSGEDGNPALKLAFEQIKAESDSRPEGNQFTVAVKYW